MASAQVLTAVPLEVVPSNRVPILDAAGLRAAVKGALGPGARLAALHGRPSGDGIRLAAVIADGGTGTLSVAAADVADSYPALTPECPRAHWFEREVAEIWGVRPEGHPWLKPVRFHASRRPGRDAWGRPDGAEVVPSVMDFFRVRGEAVHEVAVGPVHAGVIEPGHFRFQCHGEEVLHLEISLGYQHRGAERALEGGPGKRTIHIIETLAGDTTIGHATAYAEAVEALAGCAAPPRAQAIRAVALELERLANHAGDLGALAGDVGYLPTASHCGRIRGDFLNLTALLSGSRFGRGLVRPGGVGFDVEPARASEAVERLDRAMRDAADAAGLLWSTSSVMARLENTGPLPLETCIELGIVGVAARASGLEIDARKEFPSGYYRFAQVPVSTWRTGDVFARAYVRWLEMERSARFVRETLLALPQGPIRAGVGPLAPGSLVVSLVEGWRGEICHVVETDSAGRFASYKVVDPSFHNWIGLALAMRGQQISDFPLTNKSFNLSYCGHDL
jgi:Ni,Fe-hydrogenase III large subunit